MAEKSTKKSPGHDRTRIWTCICYPESAPENWRDILDEFHFEWAESPLHEFDTNPTGELKKPHWHLLFCFDGPKSYDQVASICESIQATIPQRCHSLRGMARYLCHLDNPDKHPYSVDLIVSHGGFDISSALAPTSSERYSLIEEMMDWCDSSGCSEFADLCVFARKNRREDWFPLLCDNSAFVMKEYLKSRRYRGELAGRAQAGRSALDGGEAHG